MALKKSKYSLETLRNSIAGNEFNEDDKTPEAIKQLMGGKIELDKNTEIPDAMIIPETLMITYREAMNQTRINSGISLIEVFREAFNTVMISRNRKGRQESHAIFQALLQARQNEEAEEEAFGR